MIRKIPFSDLTLLHHSLRKELIDAFEAALDESNFIGGAAVSDFENAFAAACASPHCIGVGNGTDALALILRALGIGHGDEVVVPAMTFMATAEAVSMCGAKPVFVDVDPVHMTMCPRLAEKALTANTRALLPVHLYGQPADLPALNALAERNGLHLVQDCAQAHGAAINGAPLSDWGQAQAYSFYPGKNLGALGDAGAIICKDTQLATKIRMLANHGRSKKYNHEFEGINSRLDALQARFLNIKLSRLTEWTNQRILMAKKYTKHLSGLESIILPTTRDNARHVFHLYVIRTPMRTELKQWLADHGVQTGIHYPIALHNLPAYSKFGHSPQDFPVSSDSQHQVLSLPMHPLLTSDEVEFVSQTIWQFFTTGPGANAAPIKTS